jgi:hypothetical protein
VIIAPNKLISAFILQIPPSQFSSVADQRGRCLKAERERASGTTLKAGRLQVSAPAFQWDRYLNTTAPARSFVLRLHFQQMGMRVRSLGMWNKIMSLLYEHYTSYAVCDLLYTTPII